MEPFKVASAIVEKGKWNCAVSAIPEDVSVAATLASTHLAMTTGDFSYGGPKTSLVLGLLDQING